MERMSALEMVFFKSWLMDGTFHAHLLMKVMQKSLLKAYPPRTMFTRNYNDNKFPSLWPSAKYSHDGIFTSPILQANFFHDVMIMSSGSLGLIKYGSVKVTANKENMVTILQIFCLNGKLCATTTMRCVLAWVKLIDIGLKKILIFLKVTVISKMTN